MPARRSSRTLRPSPPAQAVTVFAFPSPAVPDAGVDHSETISDHTAHTTAKDPEDMTEMELQGPDVVEIGDLLRVSISPEQNDDGQLETRWEVLDGPTLVPDQLGCSSAEYLVPDTDADHLVVAAHLRFPNGVNRQLTKRITIEGSDLPGLIRAFQQVVGQGQFSPRLTKRLADSLLKARQAQAQGRYDRLSQYLHNFARDCALILKHKKSASVSKLYHRAHWLERRAKKQL